MPQVFASKVRPAAPWAARRADADYGVSAEPSWREIDWQRELRQIVIAGRRVNYVDRGEGSGLPVVFVHGLGGCWQNWIENLPRISQERRVVALDLPGSGFSELPAEEISISGYARCVDELCERLELGTVMLVGNSMGGFVSAEVAIRFPARVDRLVLVSAAGITNSNVYRQPALTVGRIAAALATATAARHRQIAARKLARHVALQLVARHPSRLAPDLVYEGMMRGTGKPGFMDALEASISYDFRDRLPQIGCPTLIVWGEDDMVLPVRDAEQFEQLIPDTRKVVMEDTGHVPMLERPSAFNDLLLEFFDEVGEAGAKQDAAA
jgi:pimeloyl-ACP methyl ester carboxylesterase